MTFEHQFLSLLQKIILRGEHRADRTGTGTRAIFAEQIKIDLRDGFPMLSTKSVPWKSIYSELLWFIEGSGDERRLAEILHGTRDLEKKTIWSPNAEGTTGAAFKPTEFGDLGRVYGVQWRSWNQFKKVGEPDEPTYIKTQPLDQLQEVIDKLKSKPTDRRIILSAWNPGELDQMALPPCHMFAQFYLTNHKVLHCQMYQRSVDTFLGLPFNIASYAALTHMIAHVIGATAGELTMVLGDTHIYNDHADQVNELLSRTPSETLPELQFKRAVSSIDEFTMDDLALVGYAPQAAIKAKMSA